MSVVTKLKTRSVQSGSSCDDNDYTLEEIGQLFGVSRERIRQIEMKALSRLAHPTRSKKLRPFLEETSKNGETEQ